MQGETPEVFHYQLKLEKLPYDINNVNTTEDPKKDNEILF